MTTNSPDTKGDDGIETWVTTSLDPGPQLVIHDQTNPDAWLHSPDYHDLHTTR